MATAAPTTGIAPGSARAWLLATRPATLSAAIVPVAVGTATAWHAGGAAWGPALAALAGAMLLQIAANFANDVFDFEKGADTHERLGPTRVVQAGLLPARSVRLAMIAALAAALCVGIYLTWVAGAAIVVIGLASMACAVLYTGGPYPLGYHGLGDVFVMLFFGFVAVCGTAFVQCQYVPVLAYWTALPVGSLATAILVVNNLRDRHTDAEAGKRTLAVRWGRAGAFAEYVALLATAYLVPAGLVLQGSFGVAALLPWASLPLALWLLVRVGRDEGKALNRALVGTAKLLLLFGVSFALGIAFDAPGAIESLPAVEP